MRVISGKARGLKLIAPRNEDVRPTTDRVKEAMFNIIAPHIYDSKVLDLFSGSGALGIEAISRGARVGYFSDKSKDSVAMTKKNLKKARLENVSEVYNYGFEKMIELIHREKVKIDIIFVDPPYFEGLFEKVIRLIDEKNILDENGIIVIEHDMKTSIEGSGRLVKTKEKKYGKTVVTIMSLEEVNE